MVCIYRCLIAILKAFSVLRIIAISDRNIVLTSIVMTFALIPLGLDAVRISFDSVYHVADDAPNLLL